METYCFLFATIASIHECMNAYAFRMANTSGPPRSGQFATALCQLLLLYALYQFVGYLAIFFHIRVMFHF